MKISELERQVAEQIIALMEQRGIRWTERWARQRPACNGITGRPYTGGNVLTTGLWLMAHGTDDPRFIPRRHLFGDDSIGKVRKGQKGIPIVFYGVGRREDEDGEERRYRFGKIFHVWHVSQIDDLDESRLVEVTTTKAPENGIERDERIEAWVRTIGADVRHGGDSAFYSPAGDYIRLPEPDSFHSSDFYYSTLMHELVHWTGAETRLNRLREYSTTKGRAFEELIAEIGSVMLGMEHGIQLAPREDNAAYVKSWMKCLKDEPGAIFRAAAAAGRAQEYLIARSELEEAA